MHFVVVARSARKGVDLKCASCDCGREPQGGFDFYFNAHLVVMAEPREGVSILKEHLVGAPGMGFDLKCGSCGRGPEFGKGFRS